MLGIVVIVGQPQNDKHPLNNELRRIVGDDGAVVEVRSWVEDGAVRITTNIPSKKLVIDRCVCVRVRVCASQCCGGFTHHTNPPPPCSVRTLHASGRVFTEQVTLTVADKPPIVTNLYFTKKVRWSWACILHCACIARCVPTCVTPSACHTRMVAKETL